MVAERDRQLLELTERTAQLIELTRHLQTAREDERHRLARDLHDELGSVLTAARLDAANIRARMPDAPPAILALLDRQIRTLNDGVALGRRIVEDLWPSALTNLGLESALQILTDEFSERVGIPVTCQLEPVQTEPSSDVVIYRLVQEALTNIAKHAKAGQVWVRLSQNLAGIEVSVRDDGIGFDPALVVRDSHGLLGMRFRVEADGGKWRLQSAPQAGTCIRALLPRTHHHAVARPQSPDSSAHHGTSGGGLSLECTLDEEMQRAHS